MVGLVGGIPGVVAAHTWYVELNGSGDFSDIQPAVDAAAVGDTIRIGPGRYDTFHPCVAPGWTEDAIVSVTKDKLTFIGSGKDITIIGPVEYHGGDIINPKGFCSIDSYEGAIKGMTIENVEDGVYWFEGRIDIEGCSIRGFDQGFIGLSLLYANGSVLDCEFDYSDAGTACYLPGVPDGFLIQNSAFRGWGWGVRVGTMATGIVISDCSFEGSYVGVQISQYSVGGLEGCRFDQVSYIGVSVSDDSNVTLDRIVIDGADIGVRVSSGSNVSGENVSVEATRSAGVLVLLQGLARFYNSHLLPAEGLAVSCIEYPGDYQVLDMTGNYWGTTDRDSIAAMINDSNDDPEVHCTVEFEPFADGPVPTKKESLGGFRSMFR